MTDKYIRVAADFDSTGLWKDDGTEWAYDELPLPFWFLPLFRIWTGWYEDNDNYLEDSENDFPVDAFAIAGRELAEKLAKNLPDYQVWYYNEATLEVDRLPSV